MQTKREVLKFKLEKVIYALHTINIPRRSNFITKSSERHSMTKAKSTRIRRKVNGTI